MSLRDSRGQRADNHGQRRIRRGGRSTQTCWLLGAIPDPGLIVSVTGANGYPIVDLFDDLDLQEGLLRGINSYGFEKPSAVQQRGIRPVLDGRDTIGQAQSGTGKTATFVIRSFQRIDSSLNACQALILAPTRELAQQIHKVVLALVDYLNVRCHACIGGTSVRGNTDKLRDGQHVVVGTPGRVFDMLSKRHLRIDELLTFVCDAVSWL